MKTKLIIAILLFVSLQTAAQSVYNYRIKEYFEYNNSKKVLVKVSTENVGTSLTVNDQKKKLFLRLMELKRWPSMIN
jgi:hypothetical protein